MLNATPPDDLFVRTPFGWLKLTWNSSNQLNGIEWVKSHESSRSKPNSNQREALRWLEEYLRGRNPRTQINEIDWNQFTDFQKKVFRATRLIPFGKTLTYQDIARKIGEPKAYRAVGQALKSNPLVLWIPCHRVVGKKELGGYAGSSAHNISIKKHLLQHEGAFERLST